MKLHYFVQAAPDEDDLLLRDAIARSEVPVGCLLGGAVVSSLVAIGRKPCRSCDGPRARCGGDPRDADDDRAKAVESLREIVGDGEMIRAMEEFLKNRSKGGSAT